MKKILVSITSLIIIILVILCLSLFFIPKEKLLTYSINGYLNYVGIKSAKFTIQTATENKLQITDITLNDPKNFNLDNIVLSYNLDSLYSGEVQNLKVDGLKLIGKAEDDKNHLVSFGNVDIIIDNFFTFLFSKKAKSRILFHEVEMKNSLIKVYSGLHEIILPFELKARYTETIDGYNHYNMTLQLHDAEIKLIKLDIPPFGNLTLLSNLSGEIPLKWVDNDIVVDNSIINSIESGEIKFQPYTEPTGLTDEQKFVYDVLSDFKYAKFTSNIDIDNEKIINAKFKFSGRNKNLLDNSLINLDINLSVPLENLEDTFKIFYNLKEDLSKEYQ